MSDEEVLLERRWSISLSFSHTRSHALFTPITAVILFVLVAPCEGQTSNLNPDPGGPDGAFIS